MERILVVNLEKNNFVIANIFDSCAPRNHKNFSNMCGNLPMIKKVADRLSENSNTGKFLILPKNFRLKPLILNRIQKSLVHFKFQL